MVDFSKIPSAVGFFAPQRFEGDVYDCEVRGVIPPGLDGAFFRIGSQQDYPLAHPDDSPFNEDGYVSAFRFKNGRVGFKGRWIRTPRFERNEVAGRQLYGYYRNPYTDDPSIRAESIAKPWLRTVMNTAPIAHAGKLFALKEDSVPYQIDPNTLATLGPFDYGGRYKSQTFTAHPKIDPVTGEMVTYGYEATGLATDDLWVYTIDKGGRVTHEVKLKVPYVSMIHDIAVSDEHIVFPVFPYVTDMERLKAGKIHWAWDNSRTNYYGVLPRKGEAKDIRWFKGPARGIIHTANARTVGSKVIMDAPIFDGNPFPFFPFVDGSKWDPLKARALMRRLTFDLASPSDQVQEEILFPDMGVVDLVRIDDRFAGKPYRYVYTGYSDAARPFDAARAGNARGRVTNCYVRLDLQTKQVDSFFAGPTHSVQEVEFIPRGPRAAEGDGWIIGAVNNYADMRTELVVVDAQNLAAGEVARVILPFRSNVQVHGRWYSAAALGLR